MVSLRDFIRQVLDLEPVPAQLQIPRQGPARPSSTARGKGGGGAKAGGGGGEGGAGGGGMMMGLNPDPDRHS
ncbi:hypothetical protein D9M72_571960 [compost metagenome]